MEQHHDHMHRDPPSYEQSHGSQPPIILPPVPATNLPPPLYPERTLPPLPVSPPAPPPVEHAWPSSNPLSAYYQPGPSKLSPPSRPSATNSTPSKMDIDSPDSRGRRAGSVLSIEDPDVRMAAEALGDLRADFVHSPPQEHRSPSSQSRRVGSVSSTQEPEPLLSLLTTSHPLIGTAIGGSLSAYSASKNFSPRFKTGAEYVEKQFTPVINTVGSVGRFTGVEGGVRWFLGGRRPSHHPPTDDDGDSSNKRRKVGTNGTNQVKDQDASHNNDHQELHHRERRHSQSSTVESLPAYDENRSPSYEASQQALVTTRSDQVATTNQGSNWPSRLIMSTSGLSVAMSEESLRSLKYCLSWLRWANEHIGKIIVTLKSVLEKCENGAYRAEITNGEQGQQRQLVVREEDKTELNARVAELKADVLKTLKEAIDIVSKYAGGAPGLAALFL